MVKNREVLFIFYFLFCSTVIFSQENNVSKNEIIRERRYIGSIFKTDYELQITLGKEKLYNRFLPNLDQIRKAELCFLKYPIDKNNKTLFEAQKHSKKFKRQYFGYINNNGDSILFVHLINNGNFFSFKRRFEFAGWKNNFILCLYDFCYKYITYYQYNLKTMKFDNQ